MPILQTPEGVLRASQYGYLIPLQISDTITYEAFPAAADNAAGANYAGRGAMRKRLSDIPLAARPGMLSFAFLTLCIMSFFAGGCARLPAGGPVDVALYESPAPPTVPASHSPLFLVEHPSETFNRIGTPGVRDQPGKKTEIFVDPGNAAIYYEIQAFRTGKGRYTNLVYRIHFPEVPLDWGRINLTAGRNPGLLIIYTQDDQGRLLLVTTVHTCGCYLAFLPTAALPPEAYPQDWPYGKQEVYGYSLPSRIPVPREETGERILFSLAAETHRIRDAGIIDREAGEQLPSREMTLRPMRDLYALPSRDGTTPFFETDGCRAGYVKDSFKILERLFMSWWAFDLRVGEDKAYSVLDDSRTRFYTSLKFWARRASDMKDFPGFLSYWGWRF